MTNRRITNFENAFNTLFHTSPLWGDTYQKPPTYPPTNIIKVDESTYRIECAVAGFKEDDINIILENGVLTITGAVADKAQTIPCETYIHKGIGMRDFKLQYSLSNGVKVDSANLENGMLTINLEKTVKEGSYIPINTKKSTQLNG